ncbi:NosD domain-containing protein, partial [Nanoarchaeota archaeon]
SNFSKGDNVTAEITVGDDEENATAQNTSNLTISNTAPVPQSIILNCTETQNLTNGTLNAYYTYSDADSDAMAGNETKWYVDGAYDSTFDDLFSINSGNTTQKEVWIVSIRVNDSEAWGSWVNSSAITINNLVPIHSQPILNSTDGTNVTTVNLAVYNQSTSDADDDPVYNKVEWYIDGAVNTTLENATNIGSGNTSKSQIWYACISPNDGFDYGSTNCSDNITILNTAPVVTLSSPANDTNQSSELTLDWTISDDDSDAQAGYHVLVDNDSAFTSPAINVSNTTSVKSHYADLEEDKTYYWKVRVNDSEEWSSFSTVWEFSTNNKPSISAVIFPDNNSEFIGINPVMNVTISDSDTNTVNVTIKGIVAEITTEHSIKTSLNTPYTVYSADIDGDGDLDVVSAARTGSDLYWFENDNGDGLSWTDHLMNDSIANIDDVYVADIDGDDDLDILSAAFTADDVTWWNNTAGDGSAWVQVTLNGSFNGANSVYAADVDGDDDLDILATAYSANDVTWWENDNGDGSSWTQHTIDGDVRYANCIHAADFDGDNDIDVIASDDNSDDVFIWENTNGDGLSWSESYVDTHYSGCSMLRSADVDGDTDLDILGSASSAFDITWYENDNGDASSWTENTINGTLIDAYSIDGADLDDDGDIDIVGSSSYGLDWWENTAGDGSAWTQTRVDTGVIRSVHIEDLDGDTDLDIAAVDSTANEVFWWENKQVIVNDVVVQDSYVNATWANRTENTTYDWKVILNDGYDEITSDIYTFTTGILPEYSSFDGDTTDFTLIQRLNSISSNYTTTNMVLENSSYGKLTWYDGDLFVHNQDFDTNIIFNSGWVYVNSTDLNDSINSTTNITLYDLSFGNTPIVYADNVICEDDCHLISYSADNNLTLNVSHFTNYSTGVNSRLGIWDENDEKGGLNNRTTGQTIKFTANYTNITSDVAINNGTDGGWCNITFNDTDDYFSMDFNLSDDGLWTYDYTFSSAGNYIWNVTCNATNHEKLSTSDDIEVFEKAILSIWDQNDALGGNSNKTAGQVMEFYANFTNFTSGNVINNGTDGGWCNITFNNTDDYFSMDFNLSSDDLWTYNYTFTIGGNYSWNTSCDATGYDLLSETAIADVIKLATQVYNCTAITTSGDYRLVRNITDSSTNYCINISVNNVDFDCMGNTIDADDSADYGVYISRGASNTSNITVRDCIIKDWDSYGVYIKNAGNTSLVDLNLTSNPDENLHIVTADNITITNIDTDSGTHGIYIDQAETVNIYHSSLLDNSLYDLYLTAQSDDECSHTITNVTGTGTNPIVFFNSNLTLAHWNDNASEIILCNADDSVINNVTINHGATENNMILLLRTDNTNISNVVLSNFLYGLYLSTSNNTRLTDSSSTSNARSGIYISDSNYSIVTGSSFNSNTGEGIWLASASNDLVLSNCTTIGNALDGINISDSDNAVISNCTSSSNKNSGIVFEVILNASLTDSYFNNNTDYGIEFSGLVNSSIYNNYFNNSDNERSFGDVLLSYWNSSKTSGTNIIGGSYLGGNFWANSSGTAYSQTCANYRNDSICDVSYTLAASNIDYLPLTSNLNVNLNIYDDNDAAGGNQNKTTDLNITFYANYTNSTGDIPINNGTDGGWCNITFNNTDDYFSMDFNLSSDDLWSYNYSFSSEGDYDWNVTCNATNYALFIAKDDIYVNVSCEDDDGDGFGVGDTSSCTYLPEDCDDTSANVMPAAEGLLIDDSVTICSGTYYLNASETDGGLGIGAVSFNANGVTLDCNNSIFIGNSSSGTFVQESMAISTVEFNHTTIKNCIPMNYHYGIYAGGTNNTIRNNNLSHNFIGVGMGGAGESNTVSNNTFYNNTNSPTGSAGVFIESSGNIVKNNSFVEDWYAVIIADYGVLHPSGNTIVNNTADPNAAGILIQSSSNNTIKNNKISNTVYYGIVLTYYNPSAGYSYNNTIRDNVLESVGIEGFRIRESYDNYYLNNNVSGVDYGFKLYNTTNNTISGNIIKDLSVPHKRAIDLEYSSENNITNNKINNTYYGVFINSSSYNNTVYINYFYNITAYFIYNNMSASDGNQFNTSVSSVAQGNYYSDILSLNIYDLDFNGFGDFGADYPYNESQSKWFGSGADYGPMNATKSYGVNLSIWDSNDDQGGDKNATYNENLTFYANYTIGVTGEPLDNGTDGGWCNITFNTTSDYFSMEFNLSSDDLWTYNYSFTSAADYLWNVTCNSTVYDLRNKTETVGVLAPTNYSLADCADIIVAGNYNLSGDITDSSTNYCINISVDNVELDCLGNLIDGNETSIYGIYAYRSTGTSANITLKNCTLTDWATAAIYFYYVDDSTIDYVNITSNSIEGIDLHRSDNVIINNSYIADNNFRGIILHENTNVIIDNLESYSNALGLSFVGSTYNTVTNSKLMNNSIADFSMVTSSEAGCANILTNITGTDNLPIVYFNYTTTIQHWNNNASAIILCNADNSVINNVTMDHTDVENNRLNFERTDNSNISNVELSDMYLGILFSNSLNNTVWNATIKSMSSNGVYLDDSSSGNLFYNNYFNNTDNFDSTNTLVNYWNSSETVGTNILGGNTLGGNFWATPNEDGYSQTCNNYDNDDFCDDPYNLSSGSSCTAGSDCGNNTDYLALTDVYFNRSLANCTDITVAGNYNLSGDITDSSTNYCINISVDNVELDCLGNLIDGNETSIYGIYAARTTGTSANITIRNCTLTDWASAAVYFYYIDDSTLDYINASSTTYAGMYIHKSDNVLINNSYASSNNLFGAALLENTNVTVENLESYSNGYGISFIGSYNNDISDSKLMNNSIADFITVTSNEAFCANILTNITGTDNLPIVYYNDTV